MLVLLCAIHNTPASWASDGGDLCGTTELDLIPGFAIPEVPITPTDSVIDARIVFLSFPGNDTPTIPTWADSIPPELDAFIQTMSRGRQRFANFEVIRRPAYPESAWLALKPAREYAKAGGGSYGAVNTFIMKAIADSIPNVWKDVEFVFAQCTWCNNATTDATCETSCIYGGIQRLGLTDTVPDFRGDGSTQRYYHWPNVNTAYTRESIKFVAAHEYGHARRFGHSRGSDSKSATERVNPGKYDVMRASSSTVSVLGLLPYHRLHLVVNSPWPGGPGWLPFRKRIRSDTLGLRIPDSFGRI